MGWQRMGKEATPRRGRRERCHILPPPLPTPPSRGCAKGVADMAKRKGPGGGAA